MKFWTIFLFALFFAWEQNSYFGWNMTPKSDAELMADGITLLLLALSILARS